MIRHKTTSVLLLVMALAGCNTETMGTSLSNPASPLALAASTSRLLSEMRCFVTDGQSSAALPSLAAFSLARDGQVSTQAFSRPDLARSIVSAGNNNILKKARYMEYVRAVTSNEQAAIALVRRMRAVENACFDSVARLGSGDYQRLKAMAPNQRVNTGRRVITARQAIAERDEAVRRLRRSQAIGLQLYDNILSDIQKGRTTESVVSAALGTTAPRVPQPSLQSAPRQPAPSSQASPNLPPQRSEGRTQQIAPPVVTEADRSFDRLYEAYQRGLIG
jgi:hypothetical protein